MDILKNIERFKMALDKKNEMDYELKKWIYDDCDELINKISDYYVIVYDTKANDLRPVDSESRKYYQEKVQNFDLKRRRIHESIINLLAFLDRMALENHMQPIYGRMSKEEMYKPKIVIDNFNRREEIAKDVIESAAQTLKFMY